MRKKEERPTFPTPKSQYFQLQHHEQGIKCKPQIKQTFIVKDFLLQAMSQKVWGAELWWGESEKAAAEGVSEDKEYSPKPRANKLFSKKFIVKHFFHQAIPQKVCGEKGKRPRCSTFPTTMSAFTIQAKSGSKTPDKTNFF